MVSKEVFQPTRRMKMLFNSHIYIFLFLPAVLAGYFTLNRLKMVQAAKTWLVFASLLFYSYWNPKYLPLIIASMLFNYGLGTAMARSGGGKARINSKAVLAFGITVNLGFLGYFKYADFFIANFNTLAGTDLSFLRLRRFSVGLASDVTSPTSGSKRSQRVGRFTQECR
jgi:D-alanyl-lipoteichoic acid acyltransferase DltB (MBOAT superfamily)